MLIFVFVVIPLLVLVFVLPIVAIVKASSATRRVVDLEKRIEMLDAKLSQLSQVKVVKDKVSSPDMSQATVVMDEETFDALRVSESEEHAAPYVVGRDDAPADKGDNDAVTASDNARPSMETAKTPIANDQDTRRPSDSVSSFEERIGVVWFTRIGAVVGMVVTGWFFKYMVDNNWIGPWGRVALGTIAGILLLGTGEWLYRGKRTHPIFNQGMLGLGFSLLLITAYASFGFYHLIPAAAAFVIIALLCLFGGALAHYHKSELILMFSLIAAFLNPIMLSTGVDRPVVLFTYLLVMTSAGLALSVINGFRIATYMAVGGVLVLFTGWYTRYFDIHPAPPLGVFDAPSDNLPGEYFAMSRRLVPILFATLFVIEWVATALMYLKKNHRMVGISLLLTSAIASHGAMAAILYDRPSLLGGSLVAFGALFAVLLIRFALTEWLFLTMTSSFIILACLRHHIDSGNLVPVLTVSGMLSTLYFTVFLRAIVAKDRRPSTFTKLLLAGSGLGLFLLGLLFLMPDHHHVLAGFITILAAVFLLTAVVVASPAMSIGASVVGFIGLLISNSDSEDVDIGFVVIAALWFAVHTAVIAYDALKRRREWTHVHMSIFSFAGMGFAALFLNATTSESGVLRALLSIGAGAVYLVVGSLVLRSSSSKKSVCLLPLGMAALAFTSALAFLLAGPSLTVAWAAEAAVLAYLASRVQTDQEKGHAAWIFASIAVFVAAFIHLIAVDAPWIHEQCEKYLSTAGASGVLMPRAFFHPQAWSLIAVGMALLWSVFFLRKQRDGFARTSRICFLIIGHASYLILLIHEFRLLFTTRPDIPRGLPLDEMMSMWTTYQSSLADQAMRLQTITTVVMGIYALLLIVLGFVIREIWHRRLGMILFAATLVKLCLFDIWKFETLFKIIVGGAVAFLLLVGGFLYARFGSRLKPILSEHHDKMVGILLVSVVSSVAAQAGAVETHKFAWTRTVGEVSSPGDYAVEIDPAIYRASLSSPLLADIRMVGPDGAEVPYVVFPTETEESLTREAVRILDPQLLEDGASRAVIDLGETPPVHHRVILEISGTDYLRATLVESSQDGMGYGMLAEGELIHHIVSADTPAIKTSIEYPSSAARFLRITLKKGEDKNPLRIIGAKYEIAARRPRKDALRSMPLSIQSITAGKDKESVVSLAAAPEKIPIDSLRIETGNGEFVRSIEVESSTHQNAWFPQGTWTVYRILKGQGAESSVLERLTMATGRWTRPYIRLVVDNGDNPPLEIKKVFAEYTAETIVLRAAKAGTYTLYVGNKEAKPPRYDLASLIAEGSFTRYQSAVLGAMKKNPLFKKIRPKPKPLPWTEQHALVIQIGIVMVALFLLFATIRLLRKSKR